MAHGLEDRVPPHGVHLCVDMQRMFAEDTAWRTPWMPRVLPVVISICERKAVRTCFTRFIPAARPGEGQGAWAGYWRRWAEITIERMGMERVGLVPELERFVPPGRVFDKTTYSPWLDGRLHRDLTRGGVDTLIVTGAETDVCVLAAVLGAVDLGYRVIVVCDAVCSSADTSHDRLLALYHDRFGQQVETTDSAELLDAWSD